MSIEKRRYPRKPTLLDIIYFTEHTIDGEPGRMHYPGKMINISNGGVGLVANYPHQLDDRLWFEGIGELKSPILGTVRWVTGDENKYNVGVKFLSETL